MLLKKGNLYYWHKSVIVEYIGKDNTGRYVFETTNGGKIRIYPDKIASEISEE